MKGTIRASTADWQTRLEFAVRSTGDSYTRLRIYGIDQSGNRVATGVLNLITYSDDHQIVYYNAVFSLASATTIAGFELELEAGYAAVGPAFDTIAIPTDFYSFLQIGSVPLGDASITVPETLTILKPNQLWIQWESISLGGDAFGDSGHSSKVGIHIHAHLVTGAHSKIWGLAMLNLVWGVSGLSGDPLIPHGPGYGAGADTNDYFPTPDPGRYYVSGQLAADGPLTFEIKAGSTQSANDNPCTRGAYIGVSGSLLIIATDDTPVPLSLGLSSVVIYNLCPA